jgi:adenine-specific DNA methylase
LFAQEYIEPGSKGKVRKFKKATNEDRARYRKAERLLGQLEEQEGVFAPERAIPVAGRSDRRPLIHGFRRYRELFNARQLLHLTLLGRAISKVEDEKDKRLLGLAYSERGRKPVESWL